MSPFFLRFFLVYGMEKSEVRAKLHRTYPEGENKGAHDEERVPIKCHRMAKEPSNADESSVKKNI